MLVHGYAQKRPVLLLKVVTMRVFELANRIGISSVELLRHLSSMGIKASTHMSQLDDADVQKVISTYERQSISSEKHASSQSRVFLLKHTYQSVPSEKLAEPSNIPEYQRHILRRFWESANERESREYAVHSNKEEKTERAKKSFAELKRTLDEKKQREIETVRDSFAKKIVDRYKQLRLKEIECEKELKIARIKNNTQRLIKEKRSRIFWEGIWGSLVRYGVLCGILFSILALVVDYLNLQDAFYRHAGQSNFNPPAELPNLPNDSISDAAGISWWLGILTGLAVCLILRSVRANRVAMLPEEQQELSLKTKAIEDETGTQKARIDEEISQIKKGGTITKPLQKEEALDPLVEPRIRIGVPVAILGILAILLLVPAIGAFKIPSHPIFAPVCPDARDVTFVPPLKESRILLSSDCWSGWIRYEAKAITKWKVDTKGRTEYLFWDGAYYKEGREWGSKHSGAPFRLLGEGYATVAVEYKEEIKRAHSADLSGEWKGKVRTSPTRLFIIQNGLKLSGRIIYEGVEEDLEGEIKNDGQIVLKGIGYRRLSGRGSFNLDTFYGTMPDKTRIAGNYIDSAGNKGKWSVSKVFQDTPSSQAPPKQLAYTTVDVSGKYRATDTGMDIVKGQRILITASGTSKDSSASNGPEGRNFAWGDPSKFVLPHQNLMALIGKIGTNGKWFLIGSRYEGAAEESGRLFLMMNDVPGSYYNDNRGSYTVEIIIKQAQSQEARRASIEDSGLEPRTGTEAFKQSEAQSSSLLGTWSGKFGERPFELVIDAQQSDQIRGKNSIDWGRRTLSARIEGHYNEQANTITMKEIGVEKGAGEFIGTVSQDGSRMEGTWRSYDGKQQFKWYAEKGS